MVVRRQRSSGVPAARRVSLLQLEGCRDSAPDAWAGAVGLARAYVDFQELHPLLEGVVCRARNEDPVQAAPITVEIAGKLDAAVVTADDLRDRMLSGFDAFCVDAPLRVFDALRKLKELVMDLPGGS